MPHFIWRLINVFLGSYFSLSWVSIWFLKKFWLEIKKPFLGPYARLIWSINLFFFFNLSSLYAKSLSDLLFHSLGKCSQSFKRCSHYLEFAFLPHAPVLASVCSTSGLEGTFVPTGNWISQISHQGWKITYALPLVRKVHLQARHACHCCTWYTSHNQTVDAYGLIKAWGSWESEGKNWYFLSKLFITGDKNTVF